MNTPVADFVQRYAKAGTARLHMPGHKGRCFLGCEPWDITEIHGADALYEAEGILAESEQNAAALFGSQRTCYSTEGSSQCIRAMLYLAVAASGSHTVVAARNVHRAFVSAAALLDLEIRWLWPEESRSLCGCPISPAQLEETLHSLPEPPAAVYLTSPDYLGGMAEIPALAQVCHQHGTLLLVDNAHGAHLHFLQGEDGHPLHPMQLGADLCCDSLHKTLPALTGAALLHCNREEYVPQLKGAMTVFGSTSPNYLIMLSIDSTAGFLLGDGPDQLRRTVRKWGELRRLAREQGYPIPEHCDPMRLTLPLAGSGYTAKEFKALLHERRIMEEYCSDSGCVLLFSPFNREEDFARVRQFLLDCPVRQKGSFAPFPIVPSQRVMGLRQALLAPKESVDIDKAEGRISAQVKITCPPGIPLVMPGERLHKELRKILKNSGIFVMDVVK